MWDEEFLGSFEMFSVETFWGMFSLREVFSVRKLFMGDCIFIKIHGLISMFPQARPVEKLPHGLAVRGYLFTARKKTEKCNLL